MAGCCRPNVLKNLKVNHNFLVVYVVYLLVAVDLMY